MKNIIILILLLISIFSFAQKSEYKKAMKLSEDKNYADANVLFEKLLNNEFGALDDETHYDILLTSANSYEALKDYKTSFDVWKKTIIFLKQTHIHESDIVGILKYMRELRLKIPEQSNTIREDSNIVNTQSNLNNSTENIPNSNSQLEKKEINTETASTNDANSNKTVSITVSGSGKTQDDARQSALRSAIEQAFGAFISSKTEILNDTLISDQITSVANGNIQSFEILNESQLPDETWGTTLKANVSVGKLTSFVQAKGVVVEIKGGLFALNIKQQLLNEQGEEKAIYNMVGLLHEPMQLAFDYSIKSGEPISKDGESKNWEIPIEVTATANKNMDFCANYLIRTLRALSLSSEETSSYINLNKDVFIIKVEYNNITETFYLRKKRSFNTLHTFTRQWGFYTKLFKVESGIDESNGKGIEINHHDFGGIIDNYGGTEKRELSINFLNIGRDAATFSWQEKRTLAQIEQITEYKVNPSGIISKFKNGGFVVYEKDGHGLVVSISDLGGEYSWSSAKIACDKLVINGYNDWRVPKDEELNSICANLLKFGIGSGKQHTPYKYISSIKDGRGEGRYLDVTYGDYFEFYMVYDLNYEGYRCRPVRSF